MARPRRELTPHASPRDYFGAELRRLRDRAGLSAEQLGQKVHYSGALVAAVEKAQRWPKPELAEALDDALVTDGTLTRLLPLVDAQRELEDRTASTGGELSPRSTTTSRLALAVGEAADFVPSQPPVDVDLDSADTRVLLRASADASTHFLSLVGTRKLDDLLVQQLDADVERLSVDYLASPPQAVLAGAVRLRRDVYNALAINHLPKELAALHLAHGRLSGVLAYVALDLNDAHTAMAHARAALMSALSIGNLGLAAWVRGTQSLIARFQGRFKEALDFARAGRALQAGGTSSVRLRCAEAQCLAQLGDARGTLEALDAARDDLERVDERAVETGLFAFPPSKLPYYAGSSLIWLPKVEHAKAAVVESAKAITMFSQQRSGEYPPADQTLARIYQATAHLLNHELDAAHEALKPVLCMTDQPIISWHARRLGRVQSMLLAEPYGTSPTARDMVAEIREYSAASFKALGGLPES